MSPLPGGFVSENRSGDSRSWVRLTLAERSAVPGTWMTALLAATLAGPRSSPLWGRRNESSERQKDLPKVTQGQIRPFVSRVCVLNHAPKTHYWVKRTNGVMLIMQTHK